VRAIVARVSELSELLERLLQAERERESHTELCARLDRIESRLIEMHEAISDARSSAEQAAIAAAEAVEHADEAADAAMAAADSSDAAEQAAEQAADDATVQAVADAVTDTVADTVTDTVDEGVEREQPAPEVIESDAGESGGDDIRPRQRSTHWFYR